jgi:protease IV
MASDDKKPRRWKRWLLVALLVLGGWWWLRDGGRFVSVDDGSYVLVDIGGEYRERAPDDLVSKLTGDESQSLVELLLRLRAARDDSRVAGVVTRVRNLETGWAKAQEIRSALQEFRASGKKLVAYLESEFGNGTLEYFIASAAEEIYAPPGGSIVLGGLLAEYVFLGGLWEKLDVEVQVVKIGEYKTAGDMFERKSMSDAHREMANSLLDSLYGQFVSAVADARAFEESRLRDLIDRGPLRLVELEAAGIIDGVRFLDEIEMELVGEDGSFVVAKDYDAARPAAAKAPSGRVAVLYGIGTITTGESSESLFSDESVMGADTMREAFDDVTEDEEIDAIVFRVDSPGGSALASDLIWRATQRARGAKPVIVSMSDVAGSGGYYVAAGANQILAGPGTLTGSIGVVLAKPNVAGFLEKLGIHTATIQRGERAGMLSMTRSLDAAELAQIGDAMDEVYALFVDRVASGRSMSAAEVDAVGRGRVWTGEQAVEKGLVDRLGGLLAAIDEAKRAIGVDPDDKVEVVFYPRSRGFLERLADALGARAEIRSPALWSEIRRTLAILDFPEGSILTLMPQRVEIR